MINLSQRKFLDSRPSHFLIPFFVFFFSNSFSQKAVPELWGIRVHDDAHVLQQATTDALEKKLKAYEDSTSNQIAILIVQSLDGEVLESYSLRVAEKWKLGRKEKDNGVLLLIAVDDHKMRIEVGQGLEGVLTDAQSNRIIRNEMAPEFRRNDYDAGVTAGVNAIIKAIGGEYKADDNDSSSSDQLSGSDAIFFGLFIFVILGVFTFFAVFVQGCSGWGLYAFLIPFYAVFPWVVLGYAGAGILLITYIIVVPILKLTAGRSKWAKEWSKRAASRSSSGSGWSSGWSSGGGSSWGGGGGSSFSGGGGSFGGGGSSGGW